MELTILLETSSATEEFKIAVRRFCSHGEWDRIHLSRLSPPVKIVRVLSQLLATAPELEIDRVHIDAYSGCSNFTGTLRVETPNGERRFAFEWCCRWRAEQEGWRDYFGLPDQIRAAHEFGWRCFKFWREIEQPEAACA